MNLPTKTMIRVSLFSGLFLIGALFFGLRYAMPYLSNEGGEQTPAAVLDDAFLRSQRDSSTAAHDRLKQDNPAYAEAQRLRLSGQFNEAAMLYRQALASTTDVTDRTVIKFWLANSEAAAGNFKKAIALYKGMAAASTTLSRVTRAYAVQNMGHMYYRFGSPVITREIFKDEPYKDLLDSSSVELSYRHLFDYASTLYPLAYSELSSADWYADQLVRGRSASTTEYAEIIRQKLQLADKDMSSLQNDEDRRNTYLHALEKKASILGLMKRIGEDSFPDPEVSFRQLLGYYQQYDISEDGTARLQYVYFLARTYGQSRAEDIRTILAPIVAEPEGHGLVVARFLKTGRTNTSLNVRASFALLASLDPDFRKLLESYGWTAEDFAVR